MFVLSAAKAVVVFGIVGRLISLQINESKKYRTLSDKNRFREWKFSPPRGLISDYFGKEIASNRQVYQLHIIPENSENLELLIFRLKTILALSERDVLKIKKNIKSKKPWDPIIISDNLTWSDFSKINLFLHDLQGAERSAHGRDRRGGCGGDLPRPDHHGACPLPRRRRLSTSPDARGKHGSRARATPWHRSGRWSIVTA